MHSSSYPSCMHLAPAVRLKPSTTSPLSAVAAAGAFRSKLHISNRPLRPPQSSAAAVSSSISWPCHLVRLSSVVVGGSTHAHDLYPTVASSLLSQVTGILIVI